MLKRLLNLKLYLTMKRFLTLKPPRTWSKTEKLTKNLNCHKATENLAAFETAEHDTEAASHNTSDASGHESNICATKKFSRKNSFRFHLK